MPSSYKLDCTTYIRAFNDTIGTHALADYLRLLSGRHGKNWRVVKMQKLLNLSKVLFAIQPKIAKVDASFCP